MLDYESLGTVWSIAVAGGTVADEVGPVEHTDAAIAGLSAGSIRRAYEDAVATLDDEQWHHIVAGVDVFETADLSGLRRVMRKRVEQTWLAIAL